MYKTTEQKTKMQDSMISAYQVKTQAYAKQILLYKEKEQQYINYTKDLKKDVVPRTKDVAAVPAVVAPFSQRESDAAFGASLGRVVAQPMVGH